MPNFAFMRSWLSAILTVNVLAAYCQLPVARDTMTVYENGRVLKMPWANGINFANVSQLDVDLDGKKDLVFFDRMNESGLGRFRCFLNRGTPGQIIYKADPGASYSFPQVYNWAIFLDYNGDGKEDLFCSTVGGIKVYKNTSASVLNFTLVKNLLLTKYSASGVTTNLYASSIGVPGIADIDHDGDLDVLTFSSLGVYIEYHQNQSIENNGNADSLQFLLGDYCWGDISESSCEIDMNPCGFRTTWDSLSQVNTLKEKHAGSCLTCIDADGDNDFDLLMGDVACNTIQFAYNTGSSTAAVISDTTRLYPNFPAKNNTTQVKIRNFPCTYYLDVDNDGKKDLVATPNAIASENAQSVWLYLNQGTASTVNFQYVKNNLFQDEMIEVGQNSFPVLLDYNADGKKDLLIGTYGYYTNGSLSARLTLYQNTGTASAPAFSLITRDFAGLGAHQLNFAMPAPGDVDGDGDMDICIGTSSGQVHWLENTAGAGNPCNFSVFKNNPFSFTTQSAAAAPQLFDLDQDGHLDLLIGSKNGRIAYYRNTGISGSPTFSLITNFLGQVDVKGNPNIYGNDGYAVPFFYIEGNVTKLLVGSVDSRIFLYSVPSWSANFNLLSTSVNGLLEGVQSVPCYEDINNDGARDLIVGNASGGLSFFSSSSPFVTVKENVHNVSTFTLFPNPVSNELHVQFNYAPENAAIVVHDLLGNLCSVADVLEYDHLVEVGSLRPGIYFLSVSVNGGPPLVKKFIRN